MCYFVVSMGYQYHIGVVAIPELLTPNVTMAMTSVSVNEGITHWTMDQWDKVFLVNITGILLKLFALSYIEIFHSFLKL